MAGINSYESKNFVGRPAHFETPELLHAACLEYFEQCKSEKVKVTITGLCLYLGFASRSSLDDYEKRSNEFSYIVKRARLAVENGYENGGQTIDIFALKNMGWKDKMEQDINHTGISFTLNPAPGCEPIKDAK